MNEHPVQIGDWVRTHNHALPGPGAYIGQVVSIGTYSKLNIPAYLVDTGDGGKPKLCAAEALEYWFTPEKEAHDA